MKKSQRVLSIQSHVVHGYVGNKAAVFPLQLLGFDVDVINSVHFSNHTGYESKWEGTCLNGEELNAILQGLERNHLLQEVGYVLTGYIGSTSFLQAVKTVLQTIYKYNSNVRYVCDPVMGDDGKFYTSPDLLPLYQKELFPLAEVVTPNQFEAEKLTNMTIRTMEDGKQVCEALHSMGPSLVIITSLVFPKVEGNDCGGQPQSDDQNSEETITLIASEKRKILSSDGTMNITYDRWCIDSPQIPGNYTGTGDLCAALLLAWTSKKSINLHEALEKVTSTLHGVILKTFNEQGKTVASKELKLIQSKELIEDPPRLYQARKID